MGEGRPRLSFERAGRWTWAFFTREWRLLVPVALAFIALPQVTLQLLAPPLPTPGADGGSPVLHAWMLWLLPVIVLGCYGQMAITLLALRPGLSVGEALRVAVERTARLLAAMLMLALVLGALLVALSILGKLLALTGLIGGYALLTLISGATLVLLTACWVRFVLLMPAVASADPRPVAALRLTLARSRGRFWHLFGMLVPLLFVWLLVTAVLRLTLGSLLLLLLGVVFGLRELAVAIQTLLIGGVAGLIVCLFTILLVALWRQADTP